MSKSTAVSTQLVASTDKLPAHLKAVENDQRGNENVGMNVTIPRINLLQKMSSEVDKHNSKYIEGAEPGHFMNTLTQKIYGEEIYCINLIVDTVWEGKRKFEFGGGLLGTHPTRAACQESIDAQDRPEQWENVETHRHLILLKDPETGELDETPAVFDMSASKIRTSKHWNSQIVMQGGPRFSSLWKLSSRHTESKTGNTFVVLEVDLMGWAQEADYKLAEEVYGNIADSIKDIVL